VKVAFDENIPLVMVRVFESLAKHSDLLNCEIHTAKQYAQKPKEGDVPWIVRFKEAGGDVIISGDIRIRSNLHEQKALRDAGFIAFFFTSAWSQKNGFVKGAFLLNWWPKIREYMTSSKPGDLWEIPFTWGWTDLKSVKRRKGSKK